MATSFYPDARANLRRSLRSVARRTQTDARAVARPSRSRGSAAVQQGGVDGIGVTVLVGDESVYGGSNAFTDAVDEAQYGLGQGPCLAAVAAGRVVTSTRIGAGERRWSEFNVRAAALTLRSVVSAPIVTGDQVIGSLNVYSRAPLGLTDLPPQALRRLAGAAGSTLTAVRLLALAEAGAVHLGAALEDRAVVEQAVGVLMDRCTTDAHQARTLLGQLARQDGTSDAAAARTIVDSVTGIG